MSRIKTFYLILFFVPAILHGCFAQETKDRPAYAAGRFYESDSAKLVADLNVLFQNARTVLVNKNILAIISPHAGYAYSGQVSATAFKQLDPNKKYKNIFVIGSSHVTPINGASVYAVGDYLTPLGRVKVNTKLARELIDQNSYISYLPRAHINEHIIENQLPFLQYYFKNDFQIVPISVGTDNDQILQSLANTLKPYLNENNLFVISADFSHYPHYRDSQKADSLTAKGIMSNNVEEFDRTLENNALANYPGLVTSTCGSTTIKMLLYMTQNRNDLKFIPLINKNSGDVSFGDMNRVVGYFALALVKDDDKDINFLNAQDKKELIRIARLTLEEYVNKKVMPMIDSSSLSPDLFVKSGAFVTLNKNGQLRGCIGRFITDEPLYKTIQEMSKSAAVHDHRFLPVRPPELKLIDIEISVLTPLKKINSIDDIKLGRDGIYIVKGSRSGTYLPQVATETGWSLEEFLGHCAQEKAGIGWDGWKDAEIYTYQAIVFSEDKTEE